jgi:hypothetical protein
VSANLFILNDAFAKMFPSLTLISDLFTDVAKLSVFAEVKIHTHRGFWSDAIWAATYLEPLTYRLLSMRDPVDHTDLSSILQEMMRLSLLIYLGSIRRKFGIYSFKMNIQIGKLSALLREPIELGEELAGLKLLIITIGAMEAGETETKEQFNSILVELLQNLGITSMIAWEQTLKSLIWVEEAHGPQLRTLSKELDWGC